jgi:hypothetical protein
VSWKHLISQWQNGTETFDKMALIATPFSLFRENNKNVCRYFSEIAYGIL